MNCRDFITLLGGAAAAWPLPVRAQQGDRMRRIGVLMPQNENDPVFKPRLSVFTQALAALGWTDGRDVRMDVRWGRGDSNRIRALATRQTSYGAPPRMSIAFCAARSRAIFRCSFRPSSR